MKYDNIYEGRFINRPNRFIAQVEINLATRKTKWDLIAVKKKDSVVNIDSSAPNKAIGDWLSDGGFGFIPDYLKAEYRYGDSRFDFYLEHQNEKWLIEVKGVTLEEDGVAMFPDAPTQRGIKHLNGLATHAKEGYHTAAIFVIQMDQVHSFTANAKLHPEFAIALKNAQLAGVNILAYDCLVTSDQMMIRNRIPVVI
jgi:sugar fermentation stimulation protein A